MSRILVAGTRSELPIQITNLPWNLFIFIGRFGEKQNKPKQSTPESDRISRSLRRIFAEFDSWTLLYGEVTLKLPPESFRWKPQHDLNFPRSATPLHPYICTTFTGLPLHLLLLQSLPAPSPRSARQASKNIESLPSKVLKCQVMGKVSPKLCSQSFYVSCICECMFKNV